MKKGAWAGTVWRATRWSGTLKASVPDTDVGTARCRSGSFTAAITGSFIE